MRFTFFFLTLSVTSSLWADSTMKFHGRTMGTSYNITINGFRPVPLQSKVDQILAEVNQQMSTYIKDSEISRFNRLSTGQSMTIGRHFQKVLGVAKDIFNQSQGSFEPTMGPLINLWGFGPDGRVSKAPSQDKISAAQKKVGFNFVHFHNASIKTKQQGVYLDLSAIAKGYGVDAITTYLESVDLKNYLVEIGGEVRTSGVKSPGQDWKIGIELPDSERVGVLRVVTPKNLGLATSGDYRNYFEAEGRRFSHIIDPRTGRPIGHKLASVSVLAESCAHADAWATALMVLGDQEGVKVAEANKIKALFIVRSDHDFKIKTTNKFEDYLLN